ncbi:Repressible alkaline phosphatase [Sphaceloma murrayae]|uniref:Alkaline phosphatase n=1 Tax=Sphaceloma murrayae TaxID=2082308 RepID=A0A2K1QVN6_9PEZI|nr:Repressible alkaline phosphatase [Sphaceloma murrayae]
MKASLFIAAASAPAAFAIFRDKPKNFIFIIPDGMSPTSQTIARTFLEAQANGISIDDMPIGNTRTHSANNLVTDSAAAGTALAAGVKTNNGAIGVLPDGQPIGTILEAAKLEGYLTGLVVTSTINHATPASFSSHVINRNALASIVEQQVGYSHPLNQSVDILLGGGRCYFKPQSDPTSCRDDDLDLFSYAASKGYYVATNRSAFDAISSARGRTPLPWLGTFNNGDLVYDLDRRTQPEADREPSLSEMTALALEALDNGTRCRGLGCLVKRGKGYFLMIEASRIDHASHANDGAAHLHEVLEYERVMALVKRWIDEHPDTAMISVADHETGGLTIPSRYNVRALAGASKTAETLAEEFEAATGDKRAVLTGKILPAYGVTDASEAEIEGLLAAGNGFERALVNVLNVRSGLKWSTGGHTGVDVTLFGYAKGRMGEELKLTLAGNHDNVEIPRYLERALGVDMDRVTRELRAKGTGWIP